MQKDFKIGLAIGTVLAAGAVLWLATLPNLSARARALHAASNINPSPQTPAGILLTPSSDLSSEVITKEENRVSRFETSDTNNEPRVTSDETRTKIHIVQKGDTLSSISTKYYGSSRQWRKILAANHDNLPDPNRLTPGSKLLIPQ